jgi:bifunctional UDP-N-acetylglucosamine pyrophosphorylase/glucosamine-1-phosphate N-acetyltransferase
MKKIATIILAAGKGTRMKSSLPKVLHSVGGKTLVEHSLKIACSIGSNEIALVVPKESQDVENAVRVVRRPSSVVRFAIQDNQLGSGHALNCGLQSLSVNGQRSTVNYIVSLNADMPFVNPKSIRKLINLCQKKKAVMGLLTVAIDPSSSFGRVVRDDSGNVLEIVEVKDATSHQKKILEGNMGIYVFDLKFLKANIAKIKSNNKQKEYYMTDLVRLAVKAKKKVVAIKVADCVEGLGVNSQAELNLLNEIFYQRQRERFMREGVAMIGDDIYIDDGVKIAQGVKLESPCYLKGQTRIGSGSVIEGGCVLKCSHVAENVLIKAHSYLVEAEVGPECEVGPFAHLRPGAKLMKKAKVGNFVEMKKTVLGEGSKANHLTYLGDAIIGKKVNVGAGTITCNYDGFNKYQTILEDGVFVGSDTQLVAPVKVGQGALVGAGTTVTEDVAPNSLVISRIRQKEIPDWATKFRDKMSNK